MTAESASDPTTPPEQLAQLAADHPELRPLIAANPNSYPALNEWIAAQPVAKKPRRRGPVIAIVVGSIAAVVALAVVLAMVITAPRYPDTSPFDRDDLLAMSIDLAGTDQQVYELSISKRGSEEFLDDTSPQECQPFRAIAASFLFLPGELTSVENYSLRIYEEGSSTRHLSRLFTSADAAGDYLEVLTGAAAQCGTYSSEGLDTELVFDQPVSADVLSWTDAFEGGESTIVIVRNENAVFLVQGEGVSVEDFTEQVLDLG